MLTLDERQDYPALVPPVEAATSPAVLLQWASEQGVKEVDVKFTDIRGMLQHFTVPFDNFSEDAFTEGLGFDGSSIRGFQSINVSDLNLIPDPSTAFIDPVPAMKTLTLLCDVKDIYLDPYPRDPRGVARRAEAYLRQSGIADVCYFGPEAEFYIFTSARWASATRFFWRNSSCCSSVSWLSFQDAMSPLIAWPCGVAASANAASIARGVRIFAPRLRCS